MKRVSPTALRDVVAWLREECRWGGDDPAVLDAADVLEREADRRAASAAVERGAREREAVEAKSEPPKKRRKP